MAFLTKFQQNPSKGPMETCLVSCQFDSLVPDKSACWSLRVYNSGAAPTCRLPQSCGSWKPCGPQLQGSLPGGLVHTGIYPLLQRILNLWGLVPNWKKKTNFRKWNFSMKQNYLSLLLGFPLNDKLSFRDSRNGLEGSYYANMLKRHAI